MCMPRTVDEPVQNGSRIEAVAYSIGLSHLSLCLASKNAGEHGDRLFQGGLNGSNGIVAHS